MSDSDVDVLFSTLVRGKSKDDGDKKSKKDKDGKKKVQALAHG